MANPKTYESLKFFKPRCLREWLDFWSRTSQYHNIHHLQVVLKKLDHIFLYCWLFRVPRSMQEWQKGEFPPSCEKLHIRKFMQIYNISNLHGNFAEKKWTMEKVPLLLTAQKPFHDCNAWDRFLWLPFTPLSIRWTYFQRSLPGKISTFNIKIKNKPLLKKFERINQWFNGLLRKTKVNNQGQSDWESK